MSSSQIAIFCIILIVLFPLHKFVDGQGLAAGNAAKGTCDPVKCPNAKDKEKMCSCCSTLIKGKHRCYATKEICMGWCGKP
ncbi:hypothetical protein N665_0338s0045 [Sinapis alba]|nr:hypothetical protein N665_2011s0001 [Sinapis alba]KAF8095292.1 hypothetical protein N665_0338s0045 [Sinapis alba]